MTKCAYAPAFLVLYILLFSVSYTEQLQLQTSQVQALLGVKELLNSPPYLNSWKNNTDFCNCEPTATVTIVCYEDSITQLHIEGDQGAPRLSENFSIDSLFTTLAKLPSLKVLRLVSLGLWGPLPPTKFAQLSSLEILNLSSNYFQGNIPESVSSLEHLQTLILDSNSFTGRLPDGVGLLPALAVLSVANNSLHGSLPRSLGSLEGLRVLELSNNNFSGEVPDFSRLANLQVLDLANNALGPQFPVVGDKIERIVLRNNKFTLGIPSKVQSYYQMQFLDISSNRFVGPFPMSLLSLPSITYLDISENKLTGMLSETLVCNDELIFVNFTSNLLTGKLPSCLLSDPRERTSLYADNCLETGNADQQPVSFCKNQALAVGMLPNPRKQKQASKIIIALSVCGGAIGAMVLVIATFLVIKQLLMKKTIQKPLPTSTGENPSTGYSSKFLKDARYITQAMKLGSVGLPPYRTFALEELEEATNNFNTSMCIGEGSHSQMYRGQLRDGSHIAIRCIRLDGNRSSQYFMPHVEMVSKLRHHHLASALGHCFEYSLEDSSASRVFLVFEYVPNGTLRSSISERRARDRLTWGQRIAAATGVAKGIQFLHTGIVPGLFRNNLKITDVLVDQNLVAKISSYELPLLLEDMGKDRPQNFPGRSKKQHKNTRAKHQDKLDIYDFGVILLEVITGKPVNTRNEVEVLKEQLQASLILDEAMRKNAVDPTVRNTCSSESAKTMVEICWRCLLKDPSERPSIEDVLWNLQFAAQVQDAWRGDSQSSEGSPISPLQSSRLPKMAVRQ